MSELETYPEDWERALAVVAHPDDMEYGAAAAVARWTRQGKRVGYVLVTDGEAGISTMRPGEAAPIRRREQVASCEVVGVTDVEFPPTPGSSPTAATRGTAPGSWPSTPARTPPMPWT